MPAVHGLHLLDEEKEIDPVGHNKQVLAPDNEYLPAEQAQHRLTVLDPEYIPYLPAVQGVQLVSEEAADLYFPTSQKVHADEEVNPVVLEYVPAGHSTLLDEPPSQ